MSDGDEEREVAEERDEGAVGGTETEAKESEERGDDERVESEATSQDRLDQAGNPDEPGVGAPYPPKPA